jgi:hypothetical protein
VTLKFSGVKVPLSLLPSTQKPPPLPLVMVVTVECGNVSSLAARYGKYQVSNLRGGSSPCPR